MSLHNEINLEEAVCLHLGPNNWPYFGTLVTQSAVDLLLHECRAAFIFTAVTDQIDVRNNVAPAPAKRVSFANA